MNEPAYLNHPIWLDTETNSIMHVVGRFTGLNSLGSPFPGQDAGTLANPFDNDGILENWIMMNDIGMTW